MNVFENAGNYIHFKGGKYKLICHVNSEMGELVLYKSEKSDSYWLRIPENFFESVSRDGETFKRFKKTSDFDEAKATLAFIEFLNRSKTGEQITFEDDLSQFKLSQNSEMENPTVERV